MSSTFFTEKEQLQIVETIKAAELNTSGEIRLHIEPYCKDDVYDRATEVFEKLGMHVTKLKNGVLFYLAYEDKKFAVLGDQGIHEKVSQQFWDEEKAMMTEYFKTGKFCEGLSLAIQKAGEKLKAHFPYQDDDTDELTNDISFGGGEDA